MKIRDILPVLGLLLSSDATAGEGMERFLNVNRWHGIVFVQVEEAHKKHKQWNKGENYYDESFRSTMTSRYEARTGEAMPAMVDPFAVEAGGDDVAVDSPAAMMAMAMRQMQAFGKINEWKQLPLVMPPGSLSAGEMQDLADMGGSSEKSLHFTLNARYNYHEEGIDTGGDWCVDDLEDKETADLQLHGTLDLVVNIGEKTYSYSWSAGYDPRSGAKKTHEFKYTYSCEPDTNRQGSEQRDLNIVWPADPDDPEKMVTKVVNAPLPASGLRLAGVRNYVVRLPNKKFQEDDLTERHVTLKWVFVPADQPLPELPE